MRGPTRTITMFLVLAAGFTIPAARAEETPPKLHVALYAYLPDAKEAAARLEQAFESTAKAAGTPCDLELQLWEPYEAEGLATLGTHDIAEIDCCRSDILIKGEYGGLDELPPDLQPEPSAFVRPASTVLRRGLSRYVIPHWVCGNFLVSWCHSRCVNGASSFSELVTALNPDADPLLADLYGSSGLGEYYADAMLDLYGPQVARAHLIALAKNGDAQQLDPLAQTRIVQLASELPVPFRSHLDFFHEHAEDYPQAWALQGRATLIGYSERLFHAEKARAVRQGYAVPSLRPGCVVVRQVPFGQVSQGTPSWVDGFVVPRGKLAGKRAVISAFLKFVQSPAGYESLTRASHRSPASNLLPAVAAIYETELVQRSQPLLPKFRDALGDAFPVTESDVYDGMRVAGGRLKKVLTSPVR